VLKDEKRTVGKALLFGPKKHGYFGHQKERMGQKASEPGKKRKNAPV